MRRGQVGGACCPEAPLEPVGKPIVDQQAARGEATKWTPAGMPGAVDGIADTAHPDLKWCRHYS
jgi:hypothetical protein